MHILPSFFLPVLALSACAAPALSQDMQSMHVPVFFTERSAKLDPAAHDTLTRPATIATTQPADIVQVIGFADRVGSSQANIKLLRLQAQFVTDELVAAGLPTTRFSCDARVRRRPWTWRPRLAEGWTLNRPIAGQTSQTALRAES